jgi:hypothetical protein
MVLEEAAHDRARLRRFVQALGATGGAASDLRDTDRAIAGV